MASRKLKKKSQRRSNKKKSSSSQTPLLKSTDLHAERRKILQIRLGIVVLLFIISLVLPFFTFIRAVDPLKGWLVIEPLVGALLFWPLSRVLIRSMGLKWGLIFSLVPAISLIYIRLYSSTKDAVYTTDSNLAFGAMVFWGVVGMAAYLLFRQPPHQE